MSLTYSLIFKLKPHSVANRGDALAPSFGKPAPDFALPGIDGKTYTLASFVDKKVLVVIFMCNHCPYVQACFDRLIALQKEFGGRGVQLVGINSNDAVEYPDDSFEMMKKFAVEKGHNFPYLRDESQAAAKAYDAVCTPDIFVYDKKRGLAYHGRLDDNWKEPQNVTRRELAEALEALLSGKTPSHEQNPSMGCSIKWKAYSTR